MLKLSPSTPSPASFERYCTKLYTELLNFARKLTGDRQRAADVLQDSLLKAHRAWARFVPREDLLQDQAVRAWLFKIIQNTFLKHYKSERRRREVYNASPGESENSRYECELWDIASPDPRDDVEQETCDEVLEAVARLNPHHREVVELFYFEGMMIEDIAVKLSLPKNTVFTRLHRARKVMQRRLAPFAARSYGFADDGDRPRSGKRVAVIEVVELEAAA